VGKADIWRIEVGKRGGAGRFSVEVPLRLTAEATRAIQEESRRAPVC
jgi:hypothetical protein